MRVPPGCAESFPHLTDGQVLAVLPCSTSRAVIESAMIVLVQSVVLDDDSDRFDYVVEEPTYMPEANPVQRHFEIDAGGIVVVASKSAVRLVAGQLEWSAEPWPDGMTAQSFEASQRERGLR